MLFPWKGARELRSVWLPLSPVCCHWPWSGLGPRAFCLTSCCLCYDFVNLHQFMVASQGVCPDPSISCCLQKINRWATDIHTLSSCVRWPQRSEPPLLCWRGFGDQDSCILVCSELCSAGTAWDACVPCLTMSCFTWMELRLGTYLNCHGKRFETAVC